MYYIVYGFLWLLSLLPLGILYIISDFFYLLAFYVFGYRKEVVMKNLALAFPEKTEAERKKIAKKFYRNLTDMMAETIKMVTMSEKQLCKRFKGDWNTLNELYHTGKSIQFHLGHNFNWEWGNVVLKSQTLYKILAVYMPLSNKVMERLFLKLRTRNGAIFLKATQMSTDFIPHRNTQYALGLVADQNPGDPRFGWWVNFFGRPTPFVKGPAKAAIANKTVVIFAFIHKPKRGHYEAVFQLETLDASTSTEEQLTKDFVRYLEDVIRKYPDMWLWTHRRWKHEWTPEHGPVLNP